MEWNEVLNRIQILYQSLHTTWTAIFSTSFALGKSKQKEKTLNFYSSLFLNKKVISTMVCMCVFVRPISNSEPTKQFSENFV
jgi:hypothetical protein